MNYEFEDLVKHDCLMIHSGALQIITFLHNFWQIEGLQNSRKMNILTLSVSRSVYLEQSFCVTLHSTHFLQINHD